MTDTVTPRQSTWTSDYRQRTTRTDLISLRTACDVAATVDPQSGYRALVSHIRL